MCVFCKWLCALCMFVSVYYNTFHSLNTLWLQVHMYLEIPLTALSARDRAIPRISLVSNMKLSSNLFPTSTPFTRHWNTPPLATLNSTLKYISVMRRMCTYSYILCLCVCVEEGIYNGWIFVRSVSLRLPHILVFSYFHLNKAVNDRV